MSRKIIERNGDWVTVFISDIGKKETYNRNKYKDLDGNFIEKNPIIKPYTYEPYVIYKSDLYKSSDISFYSDRIIDSIYAKKEQYENLIKTMNCKNFSWKDPLQVEAIMSTFMNMDLKCTAIMKGANVATGNPYWIVYMQKKQ